MEDIHCDNVKCKHNQAGACNKTDGINIDEVGFCKDCDEEV